MKNRLPQTAFELVVALRGAVMHVEAARRAMHPQVALSRLRLAQQALSPIRNARAGAHLSPAALYAAEFGAWVSSSGAAVDAAIVEIVREKVITIAARRAMGQAEARLRVARIVLSTGRVP